MEGEGQRKQREESGSMHLCGVSITCLALPHHTAVDCVCFDLGASDMQYFLSFFLVKGDMHLQRDTLHDSHLC